jgi:O-antigen ligase
LGLALPLNRIIWSLGPFVALAVAERKLWVRTPLDVPVALFLSWMVLAGALSRYQPEALVAALLIALAVYLYFQIPYRWLCARFDATRGVAVWVWPGVAIATTAALLAYLRAPDLGLGSFRRLTLLPDLPAHLGWSLEVGMLLGLGAPQRHRWLVLGGLVVGTFGLIGTVSRWAIVGFCAGLGTWAILMRRERRWIVGVFATVAVAAAGTFALPITRAIIGQYVAPSTAPGPSWQRAMATGFSLRPGLADRLVIWGTTLRMIRDHLWVGVGPGAFMRVYLHYVPAWAEQVQVLELPVQRRAHHAHNEVLTIAAVGGVPAAAAYAAVLFTALLRAVRSAGAMPAAAPFAAALVAIIVHGMFDAVSTTYAGPLIASWIVVAGAVSHITPSPPEAG